MREMLEGRHCSRSSAPFSQTGITQESYNKSKKRKEKPKIRIPGMHSWPPSLYSTHHSYGTLSNSFIFLSSLLFFFFFKKTNKTRWKYKSPWKKGDETNYRHIRGSSLLFEFGWRDTIDGLAHSFQESDTHTQHSNNNYLKRIVSFQMCTKKKNKWKWRHFLSKIKKKKLTAIHSQRMQYMTPNGDPRSGFHLSSNS